MYGLPGEALFTVYIQSILLHSGQDVRFCALPLFLADKDIDGRSRKIPPTAQLVFQEPAIRLFHVLRQIGKEYKGRYLRVGQLRHILYFDVFALPCRWRIVLYQRQEILVEFGSGNLAHLVFIYAQCRFHHLVDALFGQGRGKDDGEIRKGRQTLTDGGFEVLDVGIGFALHQVSFVDAYHQSLFVLLDQ